MTRRLSTLLGTTALITSCSVPAQKYASETQPAEFYSPTEWATSNLLAEAGKIYEANRNAYRKDLIHANESGSDGVLDWNLSPGAIAYGAIAKDNTEATIFTHAAGPLVDLGKWDFQHAHTTNHEAETAQAKASLQAQCEREETIISRSDQGDPILVQVNKIPGQAESSNVAQSSPGYAYNRTSKNVSASAKQACTTFVERAVPSAPANKTR